MYGVIVGGYYREKKLNERWWIGQVELKSDKYFRINFKL